MVHNFLNEVGQRLGLEYVRADLHSSGLCIDATKVTVFRYRDRLWACRGAQTQVNGHPEKRSSKTRRDNATDAKRLQCKWRMFASGSQAKILAGDNDVALTHTRDKGRVNLFK